MQVYCAKACATCEQQSNVIRDKHCQNAMTQEAQDDHRCQVLAQYGRCETHPRFMRQSCLRACDWCYYEHRCQLHQLAALHESVEGYDLYQRVFERILHNHTLVNKYDIVQVHDDPPVLQMRKFLPLPVVHSFLNDIPHVFVRSTGTGALTDNMQYEQLQIPGRTSQQTWCDKIEVNAWDIVDFHSVNVNRGHITSNAKETATTAAKHRREESATSMEWSKQAGCLSHDSARHMIESIHELTGIDTVNYEQIQVLKYEIGQFYDTHHDFIPDQWDMMCGPRMLTLFMYLNDDFQGGHTLFPNIHVDVTPMVGSAVLWPNVMPRDLFSQDDRTYHKAMPLLQGTKYAANVWIHPFNYQWAYDHGCTG